MDNISNINNNKFNTTVVPQGSFGLTDSGFSSAVPSIIDDDTNLSCIPTYACEEVGYWENSNFQSDNSQVGLSQNVAFQAQTLSTPEPMSPVPHRMMDSSPGSCDSEMASKAIPTLVELLADEDPVVQSKACNMVFQLSKEKPSLEIIINSSEMLFALLEVLAKTNNNEIIESGAGVLYNLSEHRQGRFAIYKHGGVEQLIRMLSFDNELTVHLAITALHFLLLHQEGIKEQVRSSNGLPMLISLLSNPNEQFLSIVTDCIKLLAYGDIETKLDMYRLGGTMELVRILKTCFYEHLLWLVCATLKVLSACPENKKVIIENGGLQALATHLDSNVDSHVSNCLFTIRNLSDAAINQDGLNDLLGRIMHILRVSLSEDTNKQENNTITCVAGILCNLTCHNQTNKQIVRHLGGVELLIQTIVKLKYKEEITEPSVCALRHLTCRYPEAELACHAIRNCQGLVPIINLLDTSSWPLKKAVIGLIRNLALFDANVVPLREHYAIEKLADVLKEATSVSRTTEIGTGLVSMGVSMIDPKIQAIIEEAEATLQIMAKDPFSKEVIKTALSFSRPSNDMDCDMGFDLCHYSVV